MKIKQLLEILEKKAKDKWPDAKDVSVSIEIKSGTIGYRNIKYHVFSMAHRGFDFKEPTPKSDIISFDAFSVAECIKTMEQKCQGFKNGEQLELE